MALFVVSCGSPPTPEETARSDAADVAYVEAAQDRRPPLQPIRPDPITVADVELRGLSDYRCAFLQKGTLDSRPVLVTLPQKAFVKLDGKLLVFAADSASTHLPYGLRTEYGGRTHALQLEMDGKGDAAILTITDRYERPVFRTTGALDCSA